MMGRIMYFWICLQAYSLRACCDALIDPVVGPARPLIPEQDFVKEVSTPS